jgi:hypothetical protein
MNWLVLWPSVRGTGRISASFPFLSAFAPERPGHSYPTRTVIDHLRIQSEVVRVAFDAVVLSLRSKAVRLRDGVYLQSERSENAFCRG